MPEHSHDKLTVLCIDDEPEALELLAGYLTEDGYQVVTAINAELGLQMANQLKPFAITLDIIMPGKDGWSLLAELKENENTRDIPVIVVSFLDNKVLASQLGACAFMQKPIESRQLTDSLRQLTSSNHCSVLVVDDDADARELMRQVLLEEKNVTCRLAVDGQDALLELQRLTIPVPDLILLDLMMPNMDGFEFLKKIQENPLWAKIPIIVITAKVLEPYEQEFLKNRVSKVLGKDGLETAKILSDLSVIMNEFKENIKG